MNNIAMPFSGAGPLILFLAKATLLLVAALIATMSLRSGTAGSRHLVWLAALVGVLALPLLSRIPALRLGVLPSTFNMLSPSPAPMRDRVSARAVPAMAPVAAVAAVRAVHGGMAVTVATIPAIAPIATGSAVAAPMADAGSWAFSLLTMIAIAWGAVALALIGWLVAGAIWVRRIVATSRELTSPAWAMPLCEVADRLDLEQPPRLVLSDRIEMAFACRALSPTVVLPAAAETWSDDRRRAVLFHELAHVKRHDLLGHVLGRLACALYWFHPLVWTAAKNLRAESERACDDLVLRCGARPSDYAQHLLDMVTSVRNHDAPIMALPMARKKEFEGRVLAILDPAVLRGSPGPLQTAMVIGLLSLLSVTVAAVAPARAAETPTMAGSAMASAPAVATVALPTPRARALRQAPQGTLVTPPLMPPAVLGVPVARPGHQAPDSARTTMLIKILRTDDDPSVRKTAAWGLSEVGTTAAQAALTKAARGDADADVREMAVWALAEEADRSAASTLSDALLHDKSARVRATAAWGLGELGDASNASALETGASDADAEVRKTSIWAIGQLELHTAPRGVVNALTDSSKDIRLVAAWALGEIEDDAAAPAVATAFQTEADHSVRAAELRALSAMNAVTPALVETALKSADPEMRQRAVRMLAGSDAGSWPWPWPWPRPRVAP